MEKKCLCDGCQSPVYRKEYCNAHYMKLKRYGDPLFQKRRSPGSVTEEDRKRWKKEEYQRNKEKYILRNRSRRVAKAEQCRKERNRYLSQEHVKVAARKRTKEWVAKNKEHKRESDRQWIKSNRAISNGHKAKRRAKERKAVPLWLTLDQITAIKNIYFEAERLTLETGIPHQVDHIVPLSGKIVSGLHVPWNLRAIPATENNRRPRIWDHNEPV